MSASINPTFAPPAARASARFALTVLLPTPPLPLTTAIIFFTPFKIDFGSVRLLVVLLVKFTVTSASLFTSIFIAFTEAFFIRSFIGQAGVVNTIVKETLLSFITISFTIFSVTKSLPKSGSCTLPSAFKISFCVIVQLFVKKYILPQN